MKGFVPTPAATVDTMVDMLFRHGPPRAEDRVLDPGSGRGAFVDGIIRFCSQRRVPLPQIVAVELDPAHASYLAARFAAIPEIDVRQADFLMMTDEPFDYVIGNPPYVSIEGLDDDEKGLYRREFSTATGRFDLYLLFFEKALRLLPRGGRLVFITPEKYLYVKTATPLRHQLSALRVTNLRFCPEDTFGSRVTYPLVTALDVDTPADSFEVTERNGAERTVTARLPSSSWQPVLRRAVTSQPSAILLDISVRVSCGVATGADSVFVVQRSHLSPELSRFAYPTLSGRDVRTKRLPDPTKVMLVPYAPDGSLLPERDLGALGEFLRQEDRYNRLLRRTCVLRKPWYAFHENPPLGEVLRPKILCKDIAAHPLFVVDATGEILPRHSLYYIVPSDPSRLYDLADYLNSRPVADWLSDHCQRAANGFLRLQSHVLKKLPVPDWLASGSGRNGHDNERRTA